MELFLWLKKFKKRLAVGLFMGLLVGVISFWGMLVLSPKYQAHFKVLIVENRDSFVDSYTLSKSTEHLTKLFTEGIYSEAFLDKVLEDYPGLSAILSADRIERSKKWGKVISVSPNTELGTISVKVVADSRDQVLAIAQSVAQVLASENQMFVSPNQKIEVRMIDRPVVKENPSAFVLMGMAIAGFILGFVITIAYTFYRSVLKYS